MYEFLIARAQLVYKKIAPRRAQSRKWERAESLAESLAKRCGKFRLPVICDTVLVFNIFYDGASEIYVRIVFEARLDDITGRCYRMFQSIHIGLGAGSGRRRASRAAA